MIPEVEEEVVQSEARSTELEAEAPECEEPFWMRYLDAMSVESDPFWERPVY